MSWREYFTNAGLFKLVPMFKVLGSKARQRIQRNFTRLQLPEHIADFDLKSEMRGSVKTQPEAAYDFEEKNEGTLTSISSDSCIIHDKTGYVSILPPTPLPIVLIYLGNTIEPHCLLKSAPCLWSTKKFSPPYPQH